MLERGGAVLAPLADHILQHISCTTHNSELKFHLPHVATEDLVEGCGLLAVLVQGLWHLPGHEVTPLQGLHQVAQELVCVLLQNNHRELVTDTGRAFQYMN